MMIFGAGALTCPTKCGGAAFSRLTKVTQPPSRRGHRRRRRAPEIAPIEVNQTAFGWPHSKLVPSTQIQWRMIAILRAGPQADRLSRGDAAARAAALQLAAGLAAMPSPVFAALFTFWRGLRLIREIATIHGLRPGFAGSLALVQRTAVAAGSVAGIEMATNVAAHAILSSPVLQHLAGDMAGAGLAARRMLVLGRAAADACSPISPN